MFLLLICVTRNMRFKRKRRVCICVSYRCVYVCGRKYSNFFFSLSLQRFASCCAQNDEDTKAIKMVFQFPIQHFDNLYRSQFNFWSIFFSFFSLIMPFFVVLWLENVCDRSAGLCVFFFRTKVGRRI